jgi:hypothetical protein
VPGGGAGLLHPPLSLKSCLLVAFVFLLAACVSPQVATPAPTPEAVDLYYPLSLQPWADRLSICAENNPRVGLYFFPATPPATNILPNQVILSISPSENEIKSASLYQVGYEQIIAITNQANALSQLSVDELRALFSGQQKDWADGKPIQVWVLPEDDPVSGIFEQAVMTNLPMTTEAMLAPDPNAMLAAVADNTGAIGYLPASTLNSSGTVDPGKVNIVQLDANLNAKLRQPVVAMTAGEPSGELRSLLVCLETSTP